MGRLFSRWLGCAVSLLLLSALFGCSSGTSTSVEPHLPASVTLAPRPDVSMELGATQSFTVTTLDRNGTALSPAPPVTFVSSNPTVVTVSAGGLACAGTWDSLANPVVCTPGGEGTAVVNAVSMGVSSPPATIHVHQHIDSIVVTPVPNQTVSLTDCGFGLGVSGLSKGTDTFDFQATAYSRRGGPAPGLDITGTVGPFAWQSTNASVATVSSSATGLTQNQVRVTTANPGLTQIFATNNNVTSQTLSFMVCPVQSIALELSGGGGNTFTETSGSKAITATVTDTEGVEITGVPLTWSTSNAAAFTATSGSTSSVKPGSATIIASCTPPLCNVGLTPPLPIYPEEVINANATGTGTAQNTTVWVASSSCKLNGANDDNCVSDLLPIDTSKNTVGNGTDLPFLPNSLVFDRQGAKLYAGTEQSFQETHGLAILTFGTSLSMSSLLSAPGKVLAVSPDGKQVIVSDTTDSPNQAFVIEPATTPPTVTPLLITGATAADFSPDSYKAYIVAGDKLYVYSPFEALKTIQLNGPATDVSFLSNGAFAYVAGGAAAPGVSVFTNCTGSLADTQSTPAVPPFIKTAPNGTQVFALNSPGIDIINVNTTPTGCSPTVTNTVLNGGSPFNFGLGPFNATQMIVSSDGTRVYVIADNQTSIIVFNADTQTTSTIGLNAAVPLRAGLTTDGKFLYVIGSDKRIHVVDTATNTDTLQVALPQGLCHAKTGTTAQTYTCDPDLIAVRP